MKPLKRFHRTVPAHTPLKWGVNERLKQRGFRGSDCGLDLLLNFGNMA